MELFALPSDTWWLVIFPSLLKCVGERGLQTQSPRSPDWPECGCNGAHPLVILSVSEGSRCPAREILRFAQDDTEWPIRLSSPDELMEQYVGVNGWV